MPVTLDPKPAGVLCQLNMPNMEKFADQIKANAPLAKRMATADSRTGRTVVICGAGCSLADHLTTLPDADEVWAVNSALPYLWDAGVRVTHGFTIDQGAVMASDDEFGRALPVWYLLASSAHPDLTRLLMRRGRPITFFHSFLGIPDPADWTTPQPGLSYEMFLYTRLYKNSIQVGHGLNGVPRAVCLAMAMGFEHAWVYGADCACKPDGPPMPDMNDLDAYMAWMGELQFYASGRKAAVFGVNPMAEGIIDGRRWHTRPDMVISAQHLLDLAREFPGRVTLMGDTLPNALRDKPRDFFDNMPKLERSGTVSGFGVPERAVA